MATKLHRVYLVIANTATVTATTFHLVDSMLSKIVEFLLHFLCTNKVSKYAEQRLMRMKITT